VAQDKANLAKVQARLEAKQEQQSRVEENMTFLEEKREAYETLINESEEAYMKVGCGSCR
jgi:transcription elongation GreA/GreB family factor